MSRPVNKEWRVTWQRRPQMTQHSTECRTEERAVEILDRLVARGYLVLRVESRIVRPWRKVKKLHTKDITVEMVSLSKFPTRKPRFSR